MSTKEGQATKVKLEVELDDATPSSVSPSPTSTSTTPSLPGCQVPGDRLRPRGSVKRRAKANARAAQHRIFQALPFPGGYGDTRSLYDPPPSRRPLQLHPSPIVEGQRKILTVKKPAGCQPTFATLNLDGAPSPSPPPAPPSSMRPTPCGYNCQNCDGTFSPGHQCREVDGTEDDDSASDIEEGKSNEASESPVVTLLRTLSSLSEHLICFRD